jgi:hypothetical protein
VICKLVHTRRVSGITFIRYGQVYGHSQNIGKPYNVKSLEARKSKGLNRIVKIKGLNRIAKIKGLNRIAKIN